MFRSSFPDMFLKPSLLGILLCYSQIQHRSCGENVSTDPGKRIQINNGKLFSMLILYTTNTVINIINRVEMQ